MNPKVQRKFQEAQELFRQERWAEALVVFDDLSLSYKSDLDIMLNRAMCLARIGKEEEAELLCDHLTTVHRDPRAGQLKAQIPGFKRDGKSAPIEKKKRPALVSATTIKRSIITIFVLAIAYAGWTFYSTYEAPPPPTIATAPAPAGRTLSFPSDVSIGDVFTRDWGYSTNPQGDHKNSWTRLGEAKGSVTIPPGKEVRLVFEPAQIGQISALRRLGANSLQSLSINDSILSDADLKYVAHLTGLFDLSIDNSQVGPEGYKKLSRFTSLREVSLIATTLGEPGRAFIANQPYIKSIDADRADLTDAWLIGLPPMENLVFLSLDEIEHITDEGVAHIAKHRNLRKLFLSYTKITDKGLKEIQSLKMLDRLWLESTQITDAGMDGFRTMPNLGELGIAYTSVTSEGLMKLSGIRTLKKVGIRGCNSISIDGARRFHNANPDCFLETAIEL